MKKKVLMVVTVVTLVAVCAALLMACTPNADKLKEKFKDEGYIAATLSAKELDIEEDADVDYIFFATKITDTITVVAFKNGDDAKKYFDKLKDEDNKKNLKKVGNAIVFGSEAAVKLV